MIQLFYGLGVLINVLWFFTVGDWQYIMGIFYFLPLIVVIVSAILFLRDTPMCLVTRYSPKSAFKDFKFIAKLNKVEAFDLTVDDIAEARATY